MSAEKLLAGSCFVAIPTPFNAKGLIDEAALVHLLDYVAARSFEGVAILTEAAEDALLSAEERKTILDVAVRRVGAKKRILVGVSTPHTAEAVELVRHAASDAVVGFLVGPYRVPGLGYRELYRHIEKLGRVQDRRLLLVVRADNALDYLSPEELVTLTRHPKLHGAFVPGASTSQLERWAQRFRERDGDLLSGCSLTFDVDSLHGATATICALALVAADMAGECLTAIRKKDEKGVEAIKKRAGPAIDLLAPPVSSDELRGWKRLVARATGRPTEAATMQPTMPFGLMKEALRLLGHPLASHVRPPYEGVTKEESAQLKAILRASGIMS